MEKVIDNLLAPNAAGGHHVNWRRPDGLIVRFDWNGTVYSTMSCSVYDVLTTNAAGNFKLTDKYGNYKEFDPNGMPDKYVDRNGNTLDFSYNASLQVTALVDDRGQSYAFHHDAFGFIDFITDPSNRRWDFTYDARDNLISIKTPATADQPSGITTTINYDLLDRLGSVTDGRGNTPVSYTYIGATGQIDLVTIDGDTVDFNYPTSSRTDRTDRRGEVHRYHFSGQQILKTEMFVGGVAKYQTEYRYSGNDLITIVRPLGNRIDFTVDASGNVTERRRKTTDTNTNSNANDIYESWTYTGSLVASYTDELGNTTTYGRDAAGNLTSISFPTVTSPATQSSVGKSFTVNSKGQRTKETDEEGKETSFEYYSSSTAKYGLLEKVRVDPAGLNITTSYDYDVWFNISTVTNPLGKITTNTWDALRRKIEVEDAEGINRKFHFDGNGNLTAEEVENRDKDDVLDSANPWITKSYLYTVLDQLSSLTEEIDASTTRTTGFEYDESGNRVRVVLPEGNKQKWTYNERDLVASMIEGEGSAVESSQGYFYDENANLVKLVNGRGFETLFTFDLFDRLIKTTNALGHYTEQDWSKTGQILEIRRVDSTPNPDVTLQRSTRYFDERQRHWKTSDLRKDPSATYSDAVTTFERFKTGHVRYVTDARGKVTETQYDNAWRPTKTIDAMGNEFANTYNAAGYRTAWSILEKDGGTNIVHEYGATFDDIGRMLTKTETDRTNSSNVYTTSFGWDSRGNMVWTVNAEGNPTRYSFDGLNRMVKKEVALSVGTPIESFTASIDTHWVFDKNDRLVAFKDDALNTTTWAFDAKDRPSTMTYPVTSQVVAYVYDAENNVVGLTDAAGNVIEDTFDGLDRRTARDVALASGFMDTTGEAFGYDALDRMTFAEDDDYRVEWTYGVIGLSSYVYEETQKYATGTAYAKTVTTKTDAVGNLTSQTYPSGLALTYAYNDVNALSSVTDGSNTIASFTYIGLRPKLTTFGNGTTALHGYQGFRSEVGLIHHRDASSNTLLRLEYGYDKLHDRTFERFGASGAAGDAFDYDKARRLKLAWMGSVNPASPSGNVYVKTIQYNMDDDGNRTSVVTTPYGASSTTETYADNSLNQYTSVGGASQSHDASGNLTNNGTHKFKYNYKNLICEVRLSSNDSLVATYEHDALGRRVTKSVSGGVFERYIYSGVETIGVYDHTQSWKQDFVFDPTGIDRVLMLEQKDVLDQDGDSNTTELTRSYYHRNALGSVMYISTATQTEAATYRYTPYGEWSITRGGTAQSADPLGQSCGFTSRLHDAETGGLHYRARHYSSALGRFSQRDPVQEPANNLHEYCRSAPTRLTDPLGEWPISALLLDPFEVLKLICYNLCQEAEKAFREWDEADELLAAAERGYAWYEWKLPLHNQHMDEAVTLRWNAFEHEKAHGTPESTQKAHDRYARSVAATQRARAEFQDQMDAQKKELEDRQAAEAAARERLRKARQACDDCVARVFYWWWFGEPAPPFPPRGYCHRGDQPRVTQSTEMLLPAVSAARVNGAWLGATW